jgi:hypothetical protein
MGAPELAAAALPSAIPFSESETRALIKLRQEMHPQFQEKNRKRGIQQLYSLLAERLFDDGGGEWPLRPHQAVAQKWNNVVGSYKVSSCRRCCRLLPPSLPPVSALPLRDIVC